MQQTSTRLNFLFSHLLPKPGIYFHVRLIDGMARTFSYLLCSDRESNSPQFSCISTGTLIQDALPTELPRLPLYITVLSICSSCKCDHNFPTERTSASSTCCGSTPVGAVSIVGSVTPSRESLARLAAAPSQNTSKSSLAETRRLKRSGIKADIFLLGPGEMSY